MTYILPYAIQKGNLIYLLKSGNDVQSVKPSMSQHVRSHLEVHRIHQLGIVRLMLTKPWLYSMLDGLPIT